MGFSHRIKAGRFITATRIDRQNKRETGQGEDEKLQAFTHRNDKDKKNANKRRDIMKESRKRL
jgi:hypothetical protein